MLISIQENDFINLNQTPNLLGSISQLKHAYTYIDQLHLAQHCVYGCGFKIDCTQLVQHRICIHQRNFEQFLVYLESYAGQVKQKGTFFSQKQWTELEIKSINKSILQSKYLFIFKLRLKWPLICPYIQWLKKSQ